MRFFFKVTPTSDQCEAVASFVVEWMRQRERDNPEKWRSCEYSASVKPSGTVEAFCELMPLDEVQPLADAVADRFPFVRELRLGEPETGGVSVARIEWFDVQADRVVIDGESFDVSEFSISFTAITVGQYCEFLDATGHVPVPDTIECPGYTIESFKLNYGQSPKIPLFGLTYDDAIAFSIWTGCRLPTDPELRLFYETATIKQNREIEWDGENWTSTPAGEGMFYVRRGPYRKKPPDDEDKYRKPLHRRHYQHLEAPSFRIVKP